jgi:hypothetical protein
LLIGRFARDSSLGSSWEISQSFLRAFFGPTRLVNEFRSGGAAGGTGVDSGSYSEALRFGLLYQAIGHRDPQGNIVINI